MAIPYPADPLHTQRSVDCRSKSVAGRIHLDPTCLQQFNITKILKYSSAHMLKKQKMGDSSI
jgi:hypothetical protein